jgi:tetratricopeptide (TPR) repeat protein
MRRHSGIPPLLGLLVWLLPLAYPPCTPTAALASQPATPSASFDLMREALQQALHLQFPQALETAAQLETDHQPTLASSLTRGMIAYLQVRWQTPQSSAVRETGHEALQTALEEGQKQRTASTDDPQIRLFVGLAAIFDALLQQQQSSWLSLQLFARGRTLLEQTLITHETMTDAHLGLGLLYFAGADLPGLLRRFWGNMQQQNPEEAIYHLQRAAESGHFSQDVARTFLARIYELEQRYEAAITLGQELQETFPDNGYYALLTGRSQCARSHYASCAATLGALAAQLKTTETILVQRDDRFDLYYFWGRALDETGQYAEAFSAFRQAINEDPRTLRDETLWAKYYLATLYERRGQAKTARQIYRTLLRGRNVEDLHKQAEKRLARLR